MSVQTLEQRLAELLRLREAVNREIDRVQAALLPPPVRIRRSKHDIPPCGTEQGWQRHHYRGEPQDDACVLAHRHHNRKAS